MKKLWAPWRMAYIKSIGKKKKGCIFCAKPREKKDRRNLILFKGKRCFVIMNAYPYNSGHLMVVPYSHVRSFTLLKPEEVNEMMAVCQHSMRILEKALNPEGFNWGSNVGRIAGAGIQDHVHIHIVPRWSGDVNFMPVIGEVKVISEHLTATYRKLYKEFSTTRL